MTNLIIAICNFMNAAKMNLKQIACGGAGGRGGTGFISANVEQVTETCKYVYVNWHSIQGGNFFE
jgi:hypothetical protein